ncbi:TlpA family protein disulfide reductase [Cellulomonas alba]|uniref:TlpA disulfide reductase family protein n=1 Tax=Cellulomonas alba TaxID=3053467 RepID=A0ABT7SE16_9CELL|nr:TlpA disulfide reductase family protein [Cellulomonas alba]MDM7854420.1 TlpA disulfide reductase family protein [Cellulomonas alba]
MGRRVLRAAAPVLVAVLALAGCATTTSHKAGNPADVVNQGYTSGDGSTKTWPVGDRKGPVALSGTDFEGTKVDVADWRGKVVVVNTWYANCPPCRAEAPDLAKAATEYKSKGVEFVGVNGTDAQGAAQAFQSRFAIPYPSIADTSGAAIAALQGTVPVNAVPTTVFLDKQGDVAARILGLADPSTVSSILDGLVGEAAQ